MNDLGHSGSQPNSQNQSVKTWQHRDHSNDVVDTSRSLVVKNLKLREAEKVVRTWQAKMTSDTTVRKLQMRINIHGKTADLDLVATDDAYEMD